MGGYGSGRWPRVDTKTTTDHVPQLSIFTLKQLGHLDAIGSTFTLSWSSPRIAAGSVHYRIEDDRLVLIYPNSGQSIQESVYLDRTPIHFGGERRWFRCPGCRRRVGVLFCLGSYFRCRHCQRLTYTCQHETKSDRMIRRAVKYRDRLRGSGPLSQPYTNRPKHMHQRTFERLRGQARDAYMQGLKAAIEKG